MNQLALITWRLPYATLNHLETAQHALETHDDPRCFTLTTCQRALAATWTQSPNGALDRLLATLDLAGGERFIGHQALHHLAHVASGLDALVPGEDQAPHQYRQALHDQQDTLPNPLRDRLDRARAIARQARNEGNLTGHETRTILDLVQPHLPKGPLAILGTGTIATQAIQTLSPHHAIHVVSRTQERARTTAPPTATPWTRDAFLQHAPKVRTILLCTTTENDTHLLTPQTITPLLQDQPRDNPLHVIDLSLPRTTDPTLRQNPRLRLTTLEDLAHRAKTNPPHDHQIEDARNALSKALAREHRQRSQTTLDHRVKALRTDLKTILDTLTPDHLPEDNRDEWLKEAHGKIAHASQQHLEATHHGDPPP